MKHLLLILIISIFLVNCSNEKKTLNSKSASRENFVLDSMRKVLSFTDSAINITDSIKIIYGTKHYETIVFINFNVNSKIHRYVEFDSIINFYDDSYKKYYNELYNEQLEKIKEKKVSNFNIPVDFKSTWVPVFSFEKSFYLLADYPYQEFYGINDSTFICQTEMGAVPYIIDSISSHKNNLEIFTTEKGVVTFKEIDKNKSIYLMKMNDKCVYLIPYKKIHDFPIIYHLSSIDPIAGVTEYIKFDSIDCNN